MAIHPTAVIDKKAELDASVEIGPFCVVGPHVQLGAHTRLMSHVVVDNHTTLGSNNIVYPFAHIGGIPQDLKYKGEPSRLLIGDNNVIRESVTLNIGTEGGHMETRLGNGCLLMAYSHVAHDCRLGDGVILANGVALAGHVDIAEQVIVGGLAAIHQHCSIGKRAFIGGGAMVGQDIPPFCLAVGDRAELMGLNLVGLKRAGFSRDSLRALRQAFSVIFLKGYNREQALLICEQELAHEWPEVAEFCAFMRSSKRGVAPAYKGTMPSDDDTPA